MLRASRATSRVAVVSLILSIGAPNAQAAANESPNGASSVPRYRFKAGQELTYESFSEFVHSNGSSSDSRLATWTVWVVKENRDGSRRLIIQRSEEDLDRKESSITLAYCDIFSNGRVAPNPTLGFHLDPSDLFLRLPEDAHATREGWEDFNPGTSVRRLHRLAPKSNSRRWVVEVAKKSP